MDIVKTMIEAQDKLNTVSQAETDICSIYLGNVPWKATPEEISELIATKTNVHVKDVRIVKEKGTGRSRGFAFVDIYHNAPDEFIRQAPELNLGGRVLTIKNANARKKAESISESATIYTQNVKG